MRSFPIAVCLAFFLAGSLSAQEISRQHKFEQIKGLNDQIDSIVKDLLRPSPSDIAAADAAGLNVFRITPREVYGRIPIPQGGGSYYSFSTGSHDYQKTAQIGLEQDNLRIGFAGADYGFIGDLGIVPISRVDLETRGVSFLFAYKPPKMEPEIRREQRRSHLYETELFTYSRLVPAKIGHAYVLRAISFSEADILVAFTISRKDDDGSLIIFWKQLADFGKPFILYAPDSELKTSIDKIIAEKGLRLAIEVKDNVLIWLGSPTNEEMRELRMAIQAKELRIRGEDSSRRFIQR